MIEQAVHVEYRKALARRSKTNPKTGCWEWTKRLNAYGYGRIMFQRRSYMAHRWTYEFEVGPIPEGMEVDHLCRVRHCVNPAHLEVVTPAENYRRGLLPYTIRDLCRNQLHDITSPAGWIRKSNGGRTCRLCRIESNKRAAKKTAA